MSPAFPAIDKTSSVAYYTSKNAGVLLNLCRVLSECKANRTVHRSLGVATTTCAQTINATLLTHSHRVVEGVLVNHLCFTVNSTNMCTGWLVIYEIALAACEYNWSLVNTIRRL